jgi:hypothetical protein
MNRVAKMKNITFSTWNIDTNLLRLEEGFARLSHPEWRVAARMDKIISNIQSLNSDILHLQELRKLKSKFGEDIDSATPLHDFLENNGYEVLVEPLSDTGDYAFKYLTACKKSRFKIIDFKKIYLTKTPEEPTKRPDTKGKSASEIREIEHTIKEHNFGEFWERSILFTNFIDINTNEKLSTINVHFAPPERHRLESGNRRNVAISSVP